MRRLRIRRRGLVLLASVVALSACAMPTTPRAATQRVKISARPTPSTVVARDRVVVHVPARHGSIGVVVLHSLDHDISELVAQGWNKTADRHGFIAIYPTRGADWNAGLCCGSSAERHRDDVGWLTAQIRRLKATYRLSAVYLAGNSNGAMMVERLVSEEPDITNRFAVWAAAPEMVGAGTWAGVGFLYNGAADTTVPLAGGTVRIAGDPTRIKASTRTATCLPEAHLTFVTLPRLGHAPPPDWPELAWALLSTGTRDTTASLRPC